MFQATSVSVDSAGSGGVMSMEPTRHYLPSLFGVMAERWISTKTTKAPETVAGYRSLLDTVVLPTWKDVPLREIQSGDVQVWISGLSVGRRQREGIANPIGA
jgi:hypothetical protein